MDALVPEEERAAARVLRAAEAVEPDAELEASVLQRLLDPEFSPLFVEVSLQ